MTDSKAQRLADELDAFLAASPNVEATAVVSFDGLTMASALPEDMDDDRVGAMSAALLSLGEQAARGLGRGELGQIFVEADEGFVFLMSAKDEAVLVAVSDAEAKMGFVLYEMRRAAQSIGEVLASRPGVVDEDSFSEFAAFAAEPAPIAEEPAPYPAEPAPAAEEPAPYAATSPVRDSALDEPEEPGYAAANGVSHEVAPGFGAYRGDEPYGGESLGGWR